VPSLLRDIALGLLVGVFSGLFGVGGGIILVPILVIGMHVAQKRAQATSLVMVATAATAGAVTYALGESVAWAPAGLLILGGLAGTWLGTAAVTRASDRWLQFAFACLLLIAAVRMLWASTSSNDVQLPDLDFLVVAGYLVAGLSMGLLSAFMGVGGGVIIIPILITFFGFTQQLAAGTSLLVMIPIAFIGALRLTKAGYTDWSQGLRIGFAAVLGAVAGASVALVLQGSILEIGFAFLLMFAGVQMVRKAIK
jgi:uncharacterized protein